MNILRRASADNLDWVADMPAFKALSMAERFLVGSHLQWSAQAQRLAVELLTQALADQSLPVEEKDACTVSLSLALIGLSRFNDVVELLSGMRCEGATPAIQHVFNEAMARWGATGTPPRELFETVVRLDRESAGPQVEHEGTERDANAPAWPADAHLRTAAEGGTPKYSANYAQCLAVAHWALGNVLQAEKFIQKAEQLAAASRQWEFSCWRYRLVKPADFAEDSRYIRELIAGRPVRPLFFAEGTAPRDDEAV